MVVSHETYLGFRWVYFRMCSVVFWAALIANFLPDSRYLTKSPRARNAYEFIVDYVALFALNFRANLPSLEREFMGFKRRVRHAYRNWRQRKVDKSVPEDK